MTSPEVTTMDIPRVIKSALRRYEGQHRAPANTDRRAGIGIAVLLAAGTVGTLLVLYVVGWW